MADLTPGTVLAGCRIEAVAGRGGMGVVYRARQLELDRDVALKLISAPNAADPEFRARFQREWRMAAAIDHPNVLPVYGAGEDDGHLYLILRYVPGTDLHQLLRAEGGLAPGRASAIIAQVAAALDAAHAAGLVHLDVKPANVLLDGAHAYLSDFGVTRLASSATELTEAGKWVGTVDYASPERLEAERCDARSDVYSLGCLLYAALTGSPPYPRDTGPAVMLAHISAPVPLPSHAGAPAAFDLVITRAMAKRPQDRYPSAGDLARAALAAASGEPLTGEERSVARGDAAPDAATAVIARPSRPEPQPHGGPAPTLRAPAAPPQPAQRRRRGLAAAAAGLVALAAAAGAIVASGALESESAAADDEPVSAAEARRLVERFARAYGDEDAAALSRTLARGALRVLPGERQEGRRAVTAQYRVQFERYRVRDYTLADPSVSAGRVARVEGPYEVQRAGASPLSGRIAFLIARERGAPRIASIAITPA